MSISDAASTIDPRSLSDNAREDLMAEVEKGQQLAGHFPSADDMKRVHRVLTGEVSPADAVAALKDAYPVVE